MPTDSPFEEYNFKYSREVRTYEIDLQQVVHNVIYFYYFEEARIEYLKALGFPLAKEISFDGAEFVVAHNEADYHESARLGDRLAVYARISAIGRTSFTYDMKIVRADGVELCSGRTTVVSIGKGSGRPTPIPDRIRKAIETFERGSVNAAAD